MVFALFWAETECTTIKNYVEVKGEKVYLSDLLETKDSEILEQAKKVEIIRSPGAGKEKIIEGRYIKIKIKQSKIDIEDIEMPEKILIKREKFIDLSGQIKRRISEKLDELYRDKNISYEFKSSEDSIELPEGEYEIVINDKRIEEGITGEFYTYVEIISNGKLYKKLNIYITSGKKEKVYILTDNVYVGERFSYLKLELKDMVVNNEEVVTKESSKQFENKIYKGVLKKGQIIKPKDFTSIRIFKQNSKVKAVVEYNGVMVTYIGKAMEDGYLGETVKVLNEKSKKIITGSVQENGNVKINMEDF